MRSARGGIAVLALASGLACVTGLRATEKPGGVIGALAGEGIRVDRVLHQEFVDLDRDGVKEILLHAQGSMEKPPPPGTHVIPLDVMAGRTAGEGVMLPAVPRGDRFVGVFRFQRSSFRWVPVLFGTYSRARGSLVAFRSAEMEEAALVRLSFRIDSRIDDHLFRFTGSGVERVFRFERGFHVGEGFWLRGNKLLTAVGLPDPFRPGTDRPGFLARVRHRWSTGRFEPEYWDLTGYGFRGDLPLPEVPSWEPEVVERVEAARKCWDIQRAADRGTGVERFDLKELVRLRHGEETARVEYESDGFGVVVLTATGHAMVRHFFRPFFKSQGGHRSVWVALDEL